MKKVLLTGGHAGTTGLSVIKELNKYSDKLSLHWIGVRKAVTGQTANTIEYKIYPKYGVKFYPFDVGKIQTKFTRYTVPLFLKIPISFLQVFWEVLKIKSDIIVSFGGSISIPVVLYGYVFNKPVILHEQTAVGGRSNIFASKFASVIAISRTTSEKYFPEKKVVLTGNPISSQILKHITKPQSKIVKNILIMGGSRGSVWLNNAITPIVKDLAKKYKINWQVGDNNLSKISMDIKNVNVFGQLDPDAMVDLESESDIIISRSGANTVSELIALKKPSILVPIPWVYLNEQYENAKYMESLGLAYILPQKDLNPQNLMKRINELIKNYTNIKEKTKDLKSYDLDASKNLTKLILEYLDEKKIEQT